MKIIKFILNILSYLAIGVIACMALYVLTSNYQIFGGYRSFLIQSGSMEPSIMTGDIIVTKTKGYYELNDVVAFQSENRIVTHRIVAKNDQNGMTQFTTKGDANRSEDFDSINQSQIIGSVALVIPKLGYLVAFSKSWPGFIILLLVPTFLFILDQLIKIKNA